MSITCIGKVLEGVNGGYSVIRQGGSEPYTLSVLSSKVVGFVRIGEHDYPYVKVGSLYVLAENLQEKIGSSTYYNNDESNKSLGALYTCEDLTNYDGSNSAALATLLEDKRWRVPTKDDFDGIFQACGGTPVAGKALRSTEWGGDDTFGTDVKKTPILVNNSFYYYEADFWCSSHGSDNWNYIASITPNDSINGWGTNGFPWSNSSYKFPVRLCRDV